MGDPFLFPEAYYSTCPLPSLWRFTDFSDRMLSTHRSKLRTESCDERMIAHVIQAEQSIVGNETGPTSGELCG